MHHFFTKKLPVRFDYKSDLYLKRIKSLLISGGMLNDGNIPLMIYALENLPANSSILEIGLYGGLSTNVILHLSRRLNLQPQHFGCDPWMYENFNLSFDGKYIDGRNDVTTNAYHLYMMESCKTATQFLNPDSNLPILIKSTSQEFANSWLKQETVTDIFLNNTKLGSKFGFIYIDGDHSYSTAKHDLEFAINSGLNGTHILMDDTSANSKFGCAQLMAELHNYPQLEVITKKPNYLLKLNK